MLRLRDHPAGVILTVRAHAGARQNALRGEQAGALKVAVTQVAEKGKANQALIDLLAHELRLSKSQIELVAGQTQREKIFVISGLSPTELQARIDSALE